MAVRPCEKSVRCPGTDEPITNYSSEAADDLRFIGISFDPYGNHWHDPHGNYKAEGCLGVCYSTISQEDADFCAALQAYLCNQDDCDPADPNCEYHCPGDPRCSCTENDPDPNCHIHCPGDPRCNPDCPPDDPNCPYDCPGDPRCAVPPVYYNVEQHCNLTCPDGNTFTWVVPARKFAADSQVLADRMAASYCRQQGNFHLLCLSNIPDTAIEATPYKNPNGTTVRIQATGATVVSGKDVWTLVSGVIPPGLTLHLNQEVSGGIALDGVPTVFGVYSFTVKVTTPAGDFMVKTYTITVSGLYNDMGMDQAVYHPTRGTVFGVRGGYLFEFRAGSDTLLADRKAFLPICMGDSSIAYDSTTDRLFVAAWNDPGTGSTQSSGMRLFKINPTTLAIEATINPAAWTGRQFVHPYCGIHRIIARGGVIYGLLYAQFTTVSAQYNPFSYDTTSGVGTVVEDWNLPAGFNEVEINGAELWLASADGFVGIYDPTTMGNTGAVNMGATTPWGITVNSATGQAYITTRSASLLRVKQDHTVLAPITLPGTGVAPFCVRYNAFDGKVYVPTYGGNTVLVIDPATDTVVATKTGYDFAFDMVFTPTKVFCVQHGLSGIKEVI